MLGDVSVGIVLGHADKVNVVGSVIAAVEVGEVPVGESLSNFDGAIGAKVKIDEGVTLFNEADGPIHVVNDDEGF